MPVDIQYQKLKQEIEGLDLAIPGTLRTVYVKCGKTPCRCESGRKEDKHGPYFFWDRKANGKIASLTVGSEDISQFRQWIKNRQKLEKITRKLLDRGAQIASQIRK
jgi:hypothetical protein